MLTRRPRLLLAALRAANPKPTGRFRILLAPLLSALVAELRGEVLLRVHALEELGPVFDSGHAETLLSEEGLVRLPEALGAAHGLDLGRGREPAGDCSYSLRTSHSSRTVSLLHVLGNSTVWFRSLLAMLAISGHIA